MEILPEVFQEDSMNNNSLTNHKFTPPLQEFNKEFLSTAFEGLIKNVNHCSKISKASVYKYYSSRFRFNKKLCDKLILVFTSLGWTKVNHHFVYIKKDWCQND